MKNLIVASLILSASSYVAAHGCPGEMRIIDGKLPSASLSAPDLAKVKALRDEGEKLHKEGKHSESMKVLADAKKLLGV